MTATRYRQAHHALRPIREMRVDEVIKAYPLVLDLTLPVGCGAREVTPKDRPHDADGVDPRPHRPPSSIDRSLDRWGGGELDVPCDGEDRRRRECDYRRRACGDAGTCGL